MQDTNLGYQKSIKKNLVSTFEEENCSRRNLFERGGGSREGVLELLYKTNLQGS